MSFHKIPQQKGHLCRWSLLSPSSLDLCHCQVPARSSHTDLIYFLFLYSVPSLPMGEILCLSSRGVAFSLSLALTRPSFESELFSELITHLNYPLTMESTLSVLYPPKNNIKVISSTGNTAIAISC